MRIHSSPNNPGTLDPAERIARSVARRLRVLAGPGTGKSYAMKRRVARLLGEGQPPDRILAVTFTRTAAADLVHDLHELGTPGCERIHVQTLHSLCFALLQRQNVLDLSGRTPRTLANFTKSGSLQFEGAPLLSDLKRRRGFGSKRELTTRIRAFEAAWARLQTDQPGWTKDPVDQALHTELIGWLTFHRAMLIGEVVPETLGFLRNNPTCDALSAYDHVLVDEYQDLNPAEQRLVDLLSDRGDCVIVGDPNQSIYGFKYAHPEGITRYHETHENTTDEALASCRRCPKQVVELANALIGHNREVDPNLRLSPHPTNPEGEIHVVQWYNPEEEAQGLAGYVEHLVRKEDIPEQQIMILCPRRQMGYRIRDLIRDNGVSVHSFYHEETLESIEAQRALTLLSLLHNPDDRVALRWWLGAESSTHRAGSYARLWSYCEEHHQGPIEVLEQIEQGHPRIPYTGGLLIRYRELRESLAELSELPVAGVIDALFPAEETELEPLREVVRRARGEIDDVSDLFNYVSAQIRHPEVPTGPFARVMSLHKSKGLTSQVVIVTGCSEGLIPSQAPASDVQSEVERMEEQRRLFYVAITRTTERLVLSSFTGIPYRDAKRNNIRVQSAGPIGRTIASRFLQELGGARPEAMVGSAWRQLGYATRRS